MRIAHFSDIHVTASTGDIPWRAMFSKRIVGWLNLQLLGREEDFREAEEITAALVKDIQQVGADHILFTGDLTGLALDSEFERARLLLAPILDSENITGIPGNHDFYVPAAAKDGTYDRHFGSWERSELANPPPIVRLLGEEAALIALRDSRPNAFHDSSGMVGDDQLKKLDAVLADPALEGRRKLLALHYGPRRSTGEPDSRFHGLRDAEELLAAASAGGVELLLHGHLHNRFVLPAGGSTPITIATPGSATHSRYEQAYHLIDLGPEGIELSARRYDPGSGGFSEWPGAPGSGLLAPPV
ncbi:MAG: metallophosphoesterase [Planctomycetota bacterium]